MTDLSELSETEVSDKDDEDFNIDRYRDSVDSDNSLSDFSINEKDESDRGSESGNTVRDRLSDSNTRPQLNETMFGKNLVCVRYPGNVINPEKAIETLGGISKISQAVDQANRRLELRFRPDNVYCKPACGDKHSVNGFLLRIKIKKSRIQQMQDNTTNLSTEDENNERSANETNDPIEPNLSTSSNKKYEDLSNDKKYQLPKVDILGFVHTEFKFTSLCDFQYLPLAQKKDKPEELECIYDKLYPSGIPSYSWLKEDAPFFLPPPAFSRMDSQQQYAPKTEVDTFPDNVIGKNRKRRTGFSTFISFKSEETPSELPKGIETALKVKCVPQSHVEKIRELFNERPIWSKNAIKYQTQFTTDQLKLLLPSVAYYFTTGPWRVMWVKLGYDPRRDPAARIYQTLDYRLKAKHGIGSSVMKKRHYTECIVPYKLTSAKRKASFVTRTLDNIQNEKTEDVFNDDIFIYREGTIPPSRQMFYQYCDIHVEEIQEMLAKLPNPHLGTVCHEKRGWLPVGFDDQCREIINKHVRSRLRKQMNIPEEHSTNVPVRRVVSNRIKNRFNKMIKKKKPKQSILTGLGNVSIDELDKNNPSSSANSDICRPSTSASLDP